MRDTRPVQRLQPIYRERDPLHRTSGWRVGFRHPTIVAMDRARPGVPPTAGQYPEPNGVFSAIERTPAGSGGDVLVVVWGIPAWTPRRSGSGRGSDDYDAAGAVTVSYVVNKLDALRTLLSDPTYHVRSLRSGSRMYAGAIGPDLATADFVYATGEYLFKAVWSVTVQPW